jgi:hypothetical protein
MHRALLAAAGSAILMTASLSTIVGADKVIICHAAGLEGTDQYVELTVAVQALEGANGDAGHFDENGTPLAGHEQDYFGACDGGGGGEG